VGEGRVGAAWERPSRSTAAWSCSSCTGRYMHLGVSLRTECCLGLGEVRPQCLAVLRKEPERHWG
jgi:hypothetical protein